MKRLSAALIVTIAALAAAGVASAGKPQPQTLVCGGGLGTVTILTAPANGASNDFGVGRIIGGGHLIPVAFEFRATDVTAGFQLFSDSTSKGGGNGNHNQPTTTCTETQTATLADFLAPGDTVPPGAALTDTVTFTIVVQVVVK